MKKFVALLLLVLLTCASVTAENSLRTGRIGSARILGMAGATIGVTQTDDLQSMNPAALYYATEPKLQLDLQYMDTLFLDSSFSGDLEDFLYAPSVGYDLHYISSGWAVGAYSNYVLENAGMFGEDLLLNISRRNTVEFGFAFGLGTFALGGDLHIAKQSYLNGRRIPINTDPFSIATTLLQEVFLAEFKPSADEIFELGLGGMMSIGDVTFGVYSEKVVDFITESGSGISFDLRKLIAALDVGLSIEGGSRIGSETFQWFRYLLAADLHNIGDDGSRELRVGMEGALSLTDRVAGNLELGYIHPLPDLNAILSFSGGEGSIYTLGIGADLLFMNIHAALMIPNETVAYLFSEPGSSEYTDILAKITVGIFL